MAAAPNQNQNGHSVLGTVEAVTDRLAAMNRGTSSIPPASASSSATGGDSGYASQTSTPDTLKVGTFSDGSAVGGARFLWPRRVVKIKPFNKPIPQLTRSRFEDLREQYAETLNQFTKNLPNYRSSLMSLVVLGESYEKAEPWVFIQCEKIIAKQVRSFFKQPLIKPDFEPNEPSSYSPRLRIYVCDLPPQRLMRDGTNTKPADRSATDAIEVYGKNIDMTGGTLYGKQIRVFVKGTRHSATLGGLIEVVQNNGHRKIMGITAGHFLAPRLNGDEFKESDNKIEEDEIGDDTGDNFSDEGDVFVLDQSSYAHDILADHWPSSDEDEKDPMNGWSRLGKVVSISHDWLPDDGPNLDWALIAIDKSILLGNIIQNSFMMQPIMIKDKMSQRLVCINTPLVKQFGIVSNTWSYLMLEPGKVFSKTYLITISGKKLLQTGDSGSWVVDAESRELYGHVVASNVFGQVYVVPISDIFEDIGHRLSAQSVSLPRNSLSSGETNVAAKDPATAWGIWQGVPISGSTSKDVPTIPRTLDDETLPSPQLGTPQINSNPPQPAPLMHSVPMPGQSLNEYDGRAPLPYGPYSTTGLQPGVFGSSQDPIAFPTSEHEYGYDTNFGFSHMSGGHPSLSSSSNPLNQVSQQVQTYQHPINAYFVTELQRQQQLVAPLPAMQQVRVQAAPMNSQYPQASASGWGSPAPSPYIRQPDSGYNSTHVSPTPSASNSNASSPAAQRIPGQAQPIGNNPIQGFPTGTPPGQPITGIPSSTINGIGLPTKRAKGVSFF